MIFFVSSRFWIKQIWIHISQFLEQFFHFLRSFDFYFEFFSRDILMNYAKCDAIVLTVLTMILFIVTQNSS